MAPRITDPRVSVRTSQQQVLLDVQEVLGQVTQQLGLLNQRATLTNDQVEAVAADVQRLRDDIGEVRVQTNPGVQRTQLQQVPPPMQSSQQSQSNQQRQSPLRVAAVIEADQEGPQNQPVVRGSLDISANVWKVVAIVSALIALAQSVTKYLP